MVERLVYTEDVGGSSPSPPTIVSEPLPLHARAGQRGQELARPEGLHQEGAGATLAGLTAPTVIVAHGITLRVLCALALGRDLGEAEHLAVPQGSVARITGGQVALFTSGR